MPDKFITRPMTPAPAAQRFQDMDDGTFAETMALPSRIRDLSGRLKVSMHQNIYEADFEYGLQPLRWEAYTAGGGTVTSRPGSGGVLLNLTTAAGDVTIRQSRPYHRYQPGKTMGMATAVNFGTANTGQRQRVGFFDDGNGIFFEQGDPTATNPYGMFVVYRSDVNGAPVDTRISMEQWTGYSLASTLNWAALQMLFVEYAWYGGGGLRWGVIINGEMRTLNLFAQGNSGAQWPWSRTGNLPVRYEQRNLTAQIAGNSMYHWGVSVLIDGMVNEQRGFTYGYGMANGTPRRAIGAATTRYPLLSFRYRVMGTQEYTQAGAAVTAGSTTTMTVAGTPWTVGQWVGRYVFFPGLGAIGQGIVARITANTANTLTFADNIVGGPVLVAPAAAQAYTIGILNRGQLLPKTLNIQSDVAVTVELISSTPTSPVVLTGATFNPLNTLGSVNSFAERDVSATALSGGEVVYNTPSPSGALNSFDLSNFFPLYNTIRGSAPDILTVAISTSGAANVGCSIICQEAMS